MQDNNYLHDKAREDKDRMYSKIYFTASLVLTILASFSIEYLSFMSIFILTDVLLILLVIFAIGYKKQRKIFESNRKTMKSSYEDWGLKWID